jgi:hypothetical protein
MKSTNVGDLKSAASFFDRVLECRSGDVNRAWRLATASAVLIAAGGISGEVLAQAAAPAYAAAQQTNPLAKVPTPKAVDGKPDLTGFWGPILSPAGPGGIRKEGAFEPDQAALQRASGWDKPLYKPEFWDKVRSLDFSKVDVDPAYHCSPPGVPRTNAPSQIIQTPTQIVLIYGGLRTRVIPTDGRQLTPQDMDMSTFDGISVGHWDGDTLVVDSVGFNDVSWLQWQGYFHTNQMKVTERLRRQGNLLFYDFTVDDPDVLMEPWTQKTLVLRLLPPTGRSGEADPCEVIPPSGDPYMRG